MKRLTFWLTNLSLKRKLWSIQLISLSIALLLVSPLLSSYEFFSTQQELLHDTQVIADILSENSSAALIFEDQKTAKEILQSLRFNPMIALANFYLHNDHLFAAYHKNDGASSTVNVLPKLPLLLKEPYYNFGWRQLNFFKPVLLPNQTVAMIEVRVNLDHIYQRLLGFMSAVILVSLLALLLGLFLINRLQCVITQPLLELTHLMFTVSEFQDYTQRCSTTDRHDEIGLLARGFNTMLSVIEQHQSGLSHELQERKKAELELSAAHFELHQNHQQVEAAYQELARVHEHLVQSEKMASLGMLVAGIAHELNNPISYIYSNLEFIEDYIERLVGIIDTQSANPQHPGFSAPQPGHEPKRSPHFEATLKTLRELVASCREGSKRVKKIVLELRTFSRTDDIGQMPTDLHQGIESTLNLLSQQYRDRITLHREYGSLPLVECYPSQMNQVFMNLLQNAAQAIPKQGNVWIHTEPLGEWVKIVIRDNGLGITEEHLNHIFDPFFTTKDVGMGTGLGLSISYSIIEKHGGKIRVNSKIYEGTEFIIELPVRSPEKAT